MAVRGVLAALLLALFVSGARAEESKPRDVTIGPVTFQIVETSSGEKELRHGQRVLLKDYVIEAGRVLKTEKLYVATFDVSDGGNACAAWPAVVTVDEAGKVAVDTTFKNNCDGFSVGVEEDDLVFVSQALPDQNGAVWRYAPGSGFKRLGILVFKPQPNSTWNDLDKSLDHPLSLFDVAPVDAAVRKLTGRRFGELLLRLRVASGVEKKGEGYLVGTGCQPHACNSEQGFIGIDRNAHAVFLAVNRDGKIAMWPDVARWPELLRGEFNAWRRN